MNWLTGITHMFRRWCAMIAVTLLFGGVLAILPAVTNLIPLPRAGAAPVCDTDYKFLGIIPTWYKYFGDNYGVVESGNPFIPDSCGIIHAPGSDPAENFKQDAVAIGLAVIDILLRIGALVAVAFVMLGGYKYMSSQGEPKNIESAMATLVNAAIGLGVVIMASVLVSFIGHTLGG